MTKPTTIPKPTTSEFDQKSIALAFDLLEAALDDASVLDDIPNGAVLVQLPADDPAFCERAIELGMADVRRGRDVVFRWLPPSLHEDTPPAARHASDGKGATKE